MTGDQIKTLRETMDLTRPQFADLLGVNTSTVFRWEEFRTYTLAPEGLAGRLLAVLTARPPSRQAELGDQIRPLLKLGQHMAALVIICGA